MTPGFLIELLDRRHERRSFDCGVAGLNDFIKKYARQNAEEDVSRTFVAIPPPSPRVLGYYTICSGSIEPDDLPGAAAKRLPRYPVPVVNLARLAVDASMQGQGVGRDLVIDALRRVSRIADEVGIMAVTVDALDDRAKDFYLKFGFNSLLDSPLHLFLPVSVIRGLAL